MGILRALLLLLGWLAISATNTVAQYHWVVSPVEGNFEHISCSGDNCTMVGAYIDSADVCNGIWESTDGGKTWGRQPAPDSSSGSTIQRSIQRIDSLNAVIATNHSLYRTTDAGGTWEKQLEHTFAYGVGVDFADSLAGIATPWDDSVNASFITHDAGKHWTQIHKVSTSCRSYGGTEFVALGNNHILTTTDDWQTRTSTIAPVIDTTIPTSYPIIWSRLLQRLVFGGRDTILLMGAYPIDSALNSNIWSYTLEPVVSLSTDRGEHWSPLYFPPKAVHFFWEMPSLDNNIALVTCNSGQQIQSTDHGASWQQDTMIFSKGELQVYADGSSMTSSGPIGIFLIAEPATGLRFAVARREAIASSEVHPIDPQEKSPPATIFPNPASSVVILRKEPSDIAISISDALGRIVYQEESREAQVTIDLSLFAEGEYYIKCGEKNAAIPMLIRRR